MHNKEFYKIIASEESTKDFLQARGLLPDTNSWHISRLSETIVRIIDRKFNFITHYLIIYPPIFNVFISILVF